MTIYGWIFRLFGWLIGILLITGQVTYYDDGHTDGTMVFAGVAVLVLWAASLVWPLIKKRREVGLSAEAISRIVALQASDPRTTTQAFPPSESTHSTVGLTRMRDIGTDDRIRARIDDLLEAVGAAYRWEGDDLVVQAEFLEVVERLCAEESHDRKTDAPAIRASSLTATFCHRCGQRAPKDGVFCPACGTRLSGTP